MLGDLLQPKQVQQPQDWGLYCTGGQLLQAARTGLPSCDNSMSRSLPRSLSLVFSQQELCTFALATTDPQYNV